MNKTEILKWVNLGLAAVVFLYYVIRMGWLVNNGAGNDSKGTFVEATTVIIILITIPLGLVSVLPDSKKTLAHTKGIFVTLPVLGFFCLLNIISHASIISDLNTVIDLYEEFGNAAPTDELKTQRNLFVLSVIIQVIHTAVYSTYTIFARKEIMSQGTMV